jgi:hypothetical protein
MWAFLPLIVVAAYAGANSEREFFGDYQLVAVSQAWVALIVVGPLLAGWAAWDASRLRPWLDVASDGQHRGKAIARMVAPALTLAMTVVCAAVLLVTGWPSDLASWTVTAGAGFTMLAAGTFGAALGLAVPKLVAVPIGVLGTYAVMAAAVADPSRWIGRAVLVGVVAPCCASTQQVSMRSLVTAIATCAILIAGSLLVVGHPLGRRGGPLALAGLLGLTVLVAWALTLGSGPGGQLVARTSTPVCEPLGGDRICVWPEHAADQPQVRGYVQRAASTARALALPLPSVWTEKPTPHAVTVLWASGISDTEHTYALGLDIAHWVGCTTPDDEAQLAAYLALRMGAPAAEVAGRAADGAAVAGRAARLSEPAQQEWFRSRVAQCRS